MLIPNLQSLSECVTTSVNLSPHKSRPKMVCNPFYLSAYFLNVLSLNPIISTTSLKGTNVIYSILILQM
nr:MAG TPA: hypothetical protein [Bacteriophage sp.]